MKSPASPFFSTRRRALILPVASSLLFTITHAAGQDINEFTTNDSLGTGANWSLSSAPTGNANAGSHKDILISTSSTLLSHSGTFIYARSYNINNGTSYIIRSNRAVTDPPTATTFRIGSTGSTAPLPTEFTNAVSGNLNDLIFLSNNSNLTFDGVNPVEGALPPVINLPLTTGNFNISQGSNLTLGMTLTGNGAIVINGNGSTILSGDRTGNGTTTVNGGSLEITGSHTGTGTFNLNNGTIKISGSRAGGGTNIRNGTFEVTGTTGGTNYTIQNTVNNPAGTAPELKLGNLAALPTNAQIIGSTSGARSGTVNLAAAGSYTLGNYNRGTITFANSSGSPATLTFTNASTISGVSDGGRTFTNSSADLDIIFASTLDIGSTTGGNVIINTTGTITVAGDLLSTDAGVRNLIKGSAGSLILNGAGSHTGTTTLSGGLLRLNHANALPGGIGATGGTSNLVFGGTTGILGLTPASGDFLRTVGTGVDQFVANPTQDSAVNRSLGFAAFGGDRIVDIGGTISLSTGSLAGRGFVLSHTTADSKVTLVNNIGLNGASRTFLVNDGTAEVDAELSGAISSATATLVKTGAGTLALTGNNSYGSTSGGTDVQAGVLRVNGSSLSDTSKLNISGGIVHVTGTEIVGSLFFGTEEQSAGTWGATGSGADNIDDTRFAGTGVIQVGASPGTPFEVWAGNGVSFGGDANGDGISNGLAFLLGAANPQANALGLLPAATTNNGALVLTFQMRNATARGTASLNLQHSGDLGIADAWTTVAVPDTTGGPTNGVTFTITPGDPLHTVTATIADTEAQNGKLFARTSATEN